MSTSSWKNIPLWHHQREAVEVVRNYIRYFPNYHEPSSALVRMPTGTGKSGIIAVLARCFSDTPTVLLVSPWTALRDQLARDVGFRFWKKIDYEPTQWQKAVQEFVPSTASECLDDAAHQPTIMACTIQTLQILYRAQPKDYGKLKRLVSLVIVDEGHREPAPEWAMAVRDLGKPTALFTATPYRNDQRMFNVDRRFAYVYTHQSTIRDHCIREVNFHEEDFQTRDEFVDSLLTFYHNEFQQLKPSSIKDPRVIIRCETNDDIGAIAKRLDGAGEKVVAIHETFTESDEDFHRRRIPDPEEHDATFWIHQNKLIEGIDDPRFCLLAIYKPLRNARALIQQVGRILRNPTRKTGQTAWVFSHPNYRQQAYWNGYRKYEEIFNKHPEKYEPRQLFDTIIQIQPEYQYFGSDFRERFDFDKEPGMLHQQLAYVRTTSIYEIPKSFSTHELTRAVEEEWAKEDKDIRRTEQPDENTWVHIYQTMKNSPLLLKHSLVEYHLGFTIYHRWKGHLFFYDTDGQSPDYLVDNARHVSPGQLERLFHGEDARLNEIALVNSDLGQHVLRRRTLSAFSISDTAPGLTDYAHFCANARGHTQLGDDAIVRRYVGFTSARVSEPSSLRCEYQTYIRWLHSISDTLDARTLRPLSIFGRYARFARPPADPLPQNILLDLDEVQDEFEPVAPDIQENVNQLMLDESCYKINKERFTCRANGRRFHIAIHYDPAKETYKLTSPELAQAFVRKNPATNEVVENLIEHLNHSQSFRIVPKTSGVIYAHSGFYEPKLPLWGISGTARYDLLRVFRPDKRLATIESEKGTTRLKSTAGWDRCSLFYLIDHVGEAEGLAPNLHDIDILVCDDMGTEIADFIAASTSERRIMFIHAKAFSKAKQTSASAFQEVCGQATKNLSWLHPYSEILVPNLNKWDASWNGGSRLGIVERRIRRGKGDAESIWDQLSDIIRDPNSQREVWIVLGQGFSQKRFKAESKKRKPDPEIVQILFLVQSTWCAVSSVGATLRIYCST